MKTKRRPAPHPRGKWVPPDKRLRDVELECAKWRQIVAFCLGHNFVRTHTVDECLRWVGWRVWRVWRVARGRHA